MPRRVSLFKLYCVFIAGGPVTPVRPYKWPDEHRSDIAVASPGNQVA